MAAAACCQMIRSARALPRAMALGAQCRQRPRRHCLRRSQRHGVHSFNRQAACQHLEATPQSDHKGSAGWITPDALRCTDRLGGGGSWVPHAADPDRRAAARPAPSAPPQPLPCLTVRRLRHLLRRLSTLRLICRRFAPAAGIGLQVTELSGREIGTGALCAPVGMLGVVPMGMGMPQIDADAAVPLG